MKIENSTSNETRRLAKNSLVLYARMLLTLAIGLYTSRIVLRELGVVDYGLYNVLGGIVSMFVFIQGALRNASWRFITVALGKGDFYNLQKTYSTTIYIHLLLSLILILIAETAGLWFLYNKMVIPEGRMEDAFWVYQLSIVTSIFTLMSSPSNSLILAHEKMSAFAYISIYESVANLIIVFLLGLFPNNKLVTYAFLLCLVQASVRIVYLLYCRFHFNEAKLIKTFDKKLVKEISVFSGYTVLHGLGAAGCGQGLNILLNMFFGPTANAARGISIQVQHVVIRFINSFQQAVDPQITKMYTSGKTDRMHSLVTQTAKFSYYLFLIPSMLIIFKINYILELWLGPVPEETASFCIFTLMIYISETIAHPFLVGAAANGEIKKYYTIIGVLLILVVPSAYVFLKLGCPAVSVYIVHFIFSIILLYTRVSMGAKLFGYDMIVFYKKILSPVSATTIAAIGIGFVLKEIFETPDIINFIEYSVTYTVVLGFIILTIGISTGERSFIKNLALSKIHLFK